MLKDFFLKTGVRQGGVLSPILLNVYMGSVILFDLGYHIQGTYIGCLIYADDIILLCLLLLVLCRRCWISVTFVSVTRGNHFKPSCISDVRIKFIAIDCGCMEQFT